MDLRTTKKTCFNIISYGFVMTGLGCCFIGFETSPKEREEVQTLIGWNDIKICFSEKPQTSIDYSKHFVGSTRVNVCNTGGLCKHGFS